MPSTPPAWAASPASSTNSARATAKACLDVSAGKANGADLVSIIEEALDRVSTLRGRLGSVQKNVIETNVSTLGVALENISAARSEITDTDFAAETAALTKAQILQQSGISVLSIANQAPQANPEAARIIPTPDLTTPTTPQPAVLHSSQKPPAVFFQTAESPANLIQTTWGMTNRCALR